MSTKSLPVILVFAILLCMINVQAATIYVPDDYKSIQQAIDNANDGDTIIVRDGIYKENIKIDKSVTLKSENGSANCIIDGSKEGNVVTIKADKVVIEGFTVRNSGNCGYGSLLFRVAGIFVESNYNVIRNNNISNNLDGISLCFACYSSNNTIANNRVENNSGYGIYLYSAWGVQNNNTISNNNIISNKYDGIYLYKSNNNKLTNNRVENNGNNGIYLGRSSNNKLIGNIMVKNSIVIDGNTLKHFIHEIDSTNTVDGKPVYYWKNETGGKVPEDAGEVILVNCSNVLIENQELSNGTVGIKIVYSSGITIRNNDILNNSRCGICLYKSNNSTIINNRMENNKYDGIYLFDSSNNTIDSNYISNNNNGIHLSESSSNKLINNRVESDNRYGIYLWGSNNNKLTNNTMAKNRYNFGVHGSELSHYIQNIDSTNTVDGKPIYYLVNQSDMVLQGNAGFVGVVNCQNITVRDLILTNNFFGVLFAYTNNSRIENVSALNNDYGVCLVFSNNNMITNNKMEDNSCG
ncbi:MAG: right-handed parallel beta-helix repeat-containing protein, partial [Archaeoglobaceae archaeon]|nr:right-handed parallel beta-helix repeat-containing protein [Archaeoglobaceae archaeon]